MWRNGNRNAEAFGICGNQDRHNMLVMAWLMKISQIQGVIPHLIHRIRWKFFFTNLEFQTKIAD